MDWHLTWQDPVALALLVGLVLFARWLRRRVTPTGCDACAHKTGSAPSDRPTPPAVIGLDRLRLGRGGAGRRATTGVRGCR